VGRDPPVTLQRDSRPPPSDEVSGPPGPEQIDIPADWAAAIRRVRDDGLRRVLVLGATDSGKSSFCRALLRQAGQDGAVLDADPAQKLVGPPACVTLGRGAGPSLAALSFVGTLDPLRGWRRLVGGTARLAAEAAGGDLLVVNTSGLLAGAGQRLKAAKIAAVRPQLLVALGEDPRLDPILADHAAIPALRLGRSPLARRKGEGERRALRRAAFRAWLAPAPAWVLDLQGLWLDGEAEGAALPLPLPLPGQVVALADAAGRDCVLGIVLRGAPDGGALVLRAPRPEQRVAGLRWGNLRLEGDPAIPSQTDGEQPLRACTQRRALP
jgi:polynucleotide 5'-hydroxyl-kinase GRC3/NOL9